MRATGFTHVSIGARDLEESVRFYEDFFGMEEVPAPDFTGPVRWLRVGDLQLHPFQDESSAPIGHHFALDVDDFGAAFKKAPETEARVKGGNYSTIRELPDGSVQMYLRDPAGNLVEVNWRNANTLDRGLIGEIQKIGGPPGAALYMSPKGGDRR
jgi:catechol 2,3-dioxygenase-like lactoylglutathione lyase family enzyme